MIDNVFELENLERSGVLDVTVNDVSVLTSGNVADIKAPEYDAEKHALTVGTRAEGSTVGIYSVSEGYNVTASGAYSHGEGYGTVASSFNAHAEGYHTTANNLGAHSEGSYTMAGGNAHSEGSYTTASGTTSHSEGLHTIANHKSQHVFGEYNIEDNSEAANNARGNYVEIVGNGDSNTPSNARTLDWNGNEWLAGGLTIGDDNLEVPTILNGTTEPTSTDGRNNSLYVKYNDGDEVIIPTMYPQKETEISLPIDFSGYHKIRIVIEDAVDDQGNHYSYDEEISYMHPILPDTWTLLRVDGVTVGQLCLDPPTYYTDMTEDVTIYNSNPTIDNIYFKTNNTWIKDNFKDTVSTDITNLETSISNLENSIDSQFRTQTSGTYTEGGTMIAGAIAEDTVAIEPMSGYTPIGILESSATSSNNNVQLMIFNAHKVTEGIAYKLMNVGQAFSNQNFTVEFKVLYKKNNS